MDETANNSDNIGPHATVPRRGPGRPKGLPKPPGSGRQPGTPNRVTRDIREAAGKHGPKALQALVKLLDAPDPKIRAVAAREILDRAYGRPMTPTELTGKDGGPIAVDDISDVDALRRVRFLMNKAKRDAAAAGEPAGMEMPGRVREVEVLPALQPLPLLPPGKQSDDAAQRWRAIQDSRSDNRPPVLGGGAESPRVITQRPTQ